jgi:hypothetical protein
MNACTIKLMLPIAALACALGAAAPASAAPTLLVKSVRSIDIVRHTVVLPVHKGVSNGRTVWYILTDVSDATEAKSRGLSFAPLLAGAGTTMHVTATGGTWNFAAAPDFGPARTFTAGPTGFPPAAASPGAIASKRYSPFVTIGGSPVVYNAPIVATGDGPFDVATHRNTADRVLALDPAAGIVTLLLADGFAAGRRVYYISTEASDPGAATIERATYTPSIGASPASARLRIVVVVNGQAQGLAYAALHGHLGVAATAATSASLKTSANVLGGLPAATADGGVYDPLWNVEVGAWSAAAVAAKKNVTLTSVEAVSSAVDAKLLTGPGGKPFGPAGFAVNCPVIAIGDAVK